MSWVLDRLDQLEARVVTLESRPGAIHECGTTWAAGPRETCPRCAGVPTPIAPEQAAPVQDLGAEVKRLKSALAYERAAVEKARKERDDALSAEADQVEEAGRLREENKVLRQRIADLEAERR